MNETPKILLIEDDRSLARVISDYLTMSKLETVICEDGVEALEAFRKQLFDLCVVDVMLPRMDGYTLVEKIRTLNKSIPIIFLTSKSAKEDRIKGFMKGGDDFITKPFDIEELVLRIRVFLRRSGNQSTEKRFEFGHSIFDYTNYELTVNEQKQKLTQKEAEILHALCAGMNRVVKREEVLRKVWGSDDYFLGRSMDVYISKLRKYLAADSTVEIENHHGVGFKLKEKQ